MIRWIVVGMIVGVMGCEHGSDHATPAETASTAPETAASAAVATSASATVSAVAPSTSPPPDPLLVNFLNWTAKHWAQPSSAAAGSECYPPGDPDAGWGMATKYVDEERMGGKGWKPQPAAVRFDIPGFKHPITCADIGPHEEKGEHRTSHAHHTHCLMTDGPLKGHHVDIQSKSGQWHVLVFSKEYIIKDGAFAREMLGG